MTPTMCVDFPLGVDYYFNRRPAPLAIYDVATLVFLGQTEGPAERAADGTITLTYNGLRYVARAGVRTVWWVLAPLAAAAPPDVVLVARSRWTAPDGRQVTREVFEIRGGAVAREWAAGLRPPEAAWCSVTLWNEEIEIGGYGGSVWPNAWRDLFCDGTSAPRLTTEGAARFAAARAAGVGGPS